MLSKLSFRMHLKGNPNSAGPLACCFGQIVRRPLFAGSKAGGDRAAAIYTVIETAKLNGLEPQAYIADVIAKIAGDWPATRWDELLPWNWQPTVHDVAEAA